MIDLKEFLEEKYEQYNRPEFLKTDPVSIPHLFSVDEDFEIAGFLAATLAWGQRKTIINKSKELLRLMGNTMHTPQLPGSGKSFLNLHILKDPENIFRMFEKVQLQNDSICFYG